MKKKIPSHSYSEEKQISSILICWHSSLVLNRIIAAKRLEIIYISAIIDITSEMIIIIERIITLPHTLL